jgi:hypothetical protein
VVLVLLRCSCSQVIWLHASARACLWLWMAQWSRVECDTPAGEWDAPWARAFELHVSMQMGLEASALRGTHRAMV